MDINDLKAKVFYYCREKHYHSMQEASLEGLKKYPSSNIFQLYNGLSLVLSSKVNEGIRELDALQQDGDTMLGAIIALQFAHKRLASVDKEALAHLETKLKAERKRAGEPGLYHATSILLHLGKASKANEYIERLLKSNPNSMDGLVLKGWVDMNAGKIKEAGRCFETVLESNRKNMDAIFGIVRLNAVLKDYNNGIVLLSQLITRFPSFTPPLVEKMKLHLAAYNWEQALETAYRIIAIDSHCLEAIRVKVLSLVCRDADYEEAGLSLRKFYLEMEVKEPENAEMFLENAQLFSRICGRNLTILNETYRFAEKAAQLDPSNAELMSELGYQCLLKDKVKDAVRFYRNATKVDDSSLTALLGLTLCQIRESGFNQQAKQQVEFLREVQGMQPSANILLIAAQLESGNADKALNFLNSAVQTHMSALAPHEFGPRYLRCLDADLLLNIVQEYLSYAPVQSATTSSLSSGPLPVPLKQSLIVLEVVTQSCPGLLEGLYQLARIQFLSKDLKVAAKTLQHIIDDVDATCVDAHLLMAQINIQQGNYKRAEQCLERGVSFNFKVRENPIYHLIAALVQKQEGNLKECITILQTAINQTNSRTGSAGQGDSQSVELSLPDKTTLYLELAEAYRTTGQTHEAAKVIQDAIEIFKGTPEEGRIAVANAELALKRDDSQLALELLESVKPGHPYYNQACCKMADIHLHYRKDKRAFSECYRELVDNSPDASTFAMLGDAYISIQEPDLAIEAYEQALKRNPRDATLSCKMGKALIRCHLYSRAISYYKEAMKDDECSGQLKLDMAELYMKMGQCDMAEKAIGQELEASDSNDLSALVARTKLLQLLSKVKEKSGNIQASLGTLREARDNQGKVLKRAEVAQGNEDQRIVAANISLQMAEYSNMLRDKDSAIRYYKEALSYNAKDTSILVALAKLYMQTNDLEQCQMTCTLLLNADATNESAMVMMADLAFRKIDFETAMFHFQQLLEKRPNYWTALARLVEVMRRMGKLDEVSIYLTKAENATMRATQEAGLFYCKGLHEWYSGNRNSALKMFNCARRDSEWGQQSVYNMIKICLSSEDDLLGYIVDDDDALGGAREMTLRMADQLLKELRPRVGGGRDEALSYRLLGNFLLLASSQKQNIERALQDFTSLASQEAYQDHVGVAYGLAVTYMALKQIPRARNQLKRVAKYRWNFEDAEYLESCWILLTEIYIQNNKYDMASELVRRVLQHNKGSTKAYEYAGQVAEKEQGHREAAVQYEYAWKFGGKSNPAVGYKLAFNHMKSKRYADAIDVCQAVLKDHPDYPRIRKEVLEKSRNNLRT